MKLLERTENKINIDKNGGNVPRLEINKVVLYEFTVIMSTMIIDKIQVFCIYLFQINYLLIYYKFLQKIISF